MERVNIHETVETVTVFRCIVHMTEAWGVKRKPELSGLAGSSGEGPQKLVSRGKSIPNRKERRAGGKGSGVCVPDRSCGLSSGTVRVDGSGK